MATALSGREFLDLRSLDGFSTWVIRDTSSSTDIEASFPPPEKGPPCRDSTRLESDGALLDLHQGGPAMKLFSIPDGKAGFTFVLTK